MAKQQLVRPVHDRCPDCYSSQLGWRDARSKRWADQVQTEAQQSRRWVTGKLDTNYVGEMNSIVESAFGARRYSFTMRDNRLSAILEVVSPPAMVAANGNEPLRFDKLGPVTVIHRDAEVGPERIYSLMLYDVRLHDWDHASSDGEAAGAPGLVGRLWGTVFATLDAPEVPVPPGDVHPPTLVNEAAPDRGLRDQGNGESIISTSAAAESLTARRVGQVRTSGKGPRGPGWRSLDWLSIQWKRLQPPGFFTLSFVRFLLIGFILLLLTCRYPAALWALGLFLLVRFLARARLPAGMRRLPVPDWPWLIPLFLGLMTLWTFARLGADLDACRAPSWSWFVLLGACCLIPVLFRLPVIAAVAALLFLVALVISYNGTEARCGVTAAQPAFIPIAKLQQQLAAAVAPADADTDMVASESKRLQGGRISIDQALSDPNKYFRCGAVSGAADQPYEIYLGESALFAIRQAKLGPTSTAHLRKVAQLVANDPAAHIVLTGHSDKTGTSILNLRLSEQRAQNVADWLVEHGAINSEQIDVRGAGDRQPLIDDPDMFRLNRRVELRLNCQGPAGAQG